MYDETLKPLNFVVKIIMMFADNNKFAKLFNKEPNIKLFSFEFTSFVMITT